MPISFRESQVALTERLEKLYLVYCINSERTLSVINDNWKKIPSCNFISVDHAQTEKYKVIVSRSPFFSVEAGVQYWPGN